MRSVDRITLLFLLTLVPLAGCAKVENVRFPVGGGDRQALVCTPKKTKPPYPAVIFHHGMVVDLYGLSGASDRGYSLGAFCRALAKDGYLAFVPVRGGGGLEPLSKQLTMVLGAYGHVSRMENVDPARIAVMGFSRGGLLTLLAARFGLAARAFILLAPAPGPGAELAAAADDVSRVRGQILVLVARGDDPAILDGSRRLSGALRKARKSVEFHLYPGGPSGCKPGPGPPCAHKLFYRVGAYWSDVRDFLRKTLR